MQYRREQIDDLVERAIVATLNRPVVLSPADSLVLTLGFDSLRVASLSIALEDELERPILLNDWLARSGDPESLTVGSLRDYVWELVRPREEARL